jgi:hypothetical protein
MIAVVAILAQFFPRQGLGDQHVDETLREELLTVAVPIWRALDDRQFRLQVNLYVKFYEGTVAELGEPFEQGRFFACDDAMDLRVLRFTTPKHPNSISHEVFNPRYEFDISCEDASIKGTLTELKVHEGDGEGLIDPISNWSSTLSYLKSHSQIGQVPLVEIMSSPDFEIVDLRATDESIYLIQLTAKYSGLKDRFRTPGGIYTMVVDRNNNYRLVEKASRFADSDKVYNYRMNYHEPDNCGVPREVIFSGTSGTHAFRHEWTIDCPEPLAIPAEEFYLPHYGFSEQVLQTLKPNPWPRWMLILCGICSLGLGAWLIQRRTART